MRDALNGQLNGEIYSAYLYLSMAACFYSIGLPGFGQWMKAQRLEELVHALRFFDYVVEQGGRVKMMAVEGPPIEWDSPLAAFEAALAHEKKVTGLINGLVDVAVGEGDDTTREFLQWYVDEQEEEEESAGSVVEKIRATGGSKDAMTALDEELGRR